MNLQEEIGSLAYVLYEKSGRIEGRALQDWLDAERIVLARHASQDIEEPEGEEPLLGEETISGEVEGKELRSEMKGEEEETTVMEEVEARGPSIVGGKGRTGKKAAALGKKKGPGKRG